MTTVGGHEEHMFASKHALCTLILCFSRGSAMEQDIFSPNLANIIDGLLIIMDPVNHSIDLFTFLKDLIHNIKQDCI